MEPPLPGSILKAPYGASERLGSLTNGGIKCHILSSKFYDHYNCNTYRHEVYRQIHLAGSRLYQWHVMSYCVFIVVVKSGNEIEFCFKIGLELLASYGTSQFIDESIQNRMPRAAINKPQPR